MSKSIIVGTGSYLPDKILYNSDLESMVDTNDEWIRSRTGIKQRYIAADDEFTSDMAVKAARDAIDKSGVNSHDIDLIIVATTTPDKTFPSTGVYVQHKLGITNGAAFDVQAVCSGFVYALSVADNFLKTGQCKTAVVIGADKMSSIIDWQDRNTCVLFGDGAGAVIIQQGDDGNRGIISTNLYSDGSYQAILNTDGGVSSSGEVGKLRMQGKEVFKHAVAKMSKCVEDALAEFDLSIGDVDVLIPHQANSRILDMVAKKLEIPTDKVLMTLDLHANTSAASIPLAIADADSKGSFKQGDLVVLTALGGGLTWGSCLIRW